MNLSRVIKELVLRSIKLYNKGRLKGRPLTSRNKSFSNFVIVGQLKEGFAHFRRTEGDFIV